MRTRNRYQIDLWVLIAGYPDSGLKREVRAFRSDLSKNYPRHGLQIYDIGKILDQYCRNIERLQAPTVELQILKNEFHEHDDSSLVVTVPAAEIARIVKLHKLSLFEQNARVPLIRSPVNLEIQETLTDPLKRRSFWYRNNGLTVICRSFRWMNRSKDRLTIEGMQIVNGCQTAWVISKHPKSLRGVHVLARLIQTEDKNFADAIRRGTNWQKAVTERDLRSGDLIQRKLQFEFSRLDYYYERKEDEWTRLCKLMTKIHMKSEYPKENLDNYDLAQLYLAFWLTMPAQAKMKKALIFKSRIKRRGVEETGSYYDKIFKPTTTADELLLPYLVDDHLYYEFDVGYLPRMDRIPLKRKVLKHGNFTLLALVGEVLKRKYRLSAGSKSSRKKIRLLNTALEDLQHHKQIIHSFNKAIKYMIDATFGFVKQELRKDKTLTPRTLLVRDRTVINMLNDQKVKKAIKNSTKILPIL